MWAQFATYAAIIVPAIGALFVMHDRLARALERVSALEGSAQRQGERLGDHDTRLAVLERETTGVRRRPTRGVPGAGE